MDFLLDNDNRPGILTWYLQHRLIQVLLMLRSTFHFTSMRYCDDIIHYIASMNGDILIFIASVEDNAYVAAEAVAMRCSGG